MPENLTAVRAAIDTVIDYATAHHNPPLVKALESQRDGIDAQAAQDKADYELGYAVLDQTEAIGWNPAVPIATFGRIIRKAIEATGARIVAGHEQPEDAAQLRAERDRYRAWIQDVARRGTHYDPNPTTTGSPEKRIGLLADYIRCMDTAMRETARRVLEGEGVEVGDEQPVGELIAFARVKDLQGGDWCVLKTYPASHLDVAQHHHRPEERIAALYLLPEAVAGDE